MHSYSGKKGAGKEARAPVPLDEAEQARRWGEIWANICKPAIEFNARVKQARALLLADPDIELTRVIKSKGSVTKIISPGPD